MGTLNIDFQDGFSGDEVIAELNGNEVYHRTSLNTDYSIGLADSVQLDVASLPCELRIRLPKKDVRLLIKFAGELPLLIRISLQDGDLVWQASDTPYLYF